MNPMIAVKNSYSPVRRNPNGKIMAAKDETPPTYIKSASLLKMCLGCDVKVILDRKL